jgi:hypothetical protein
MYLSILFFDLKASQSLALHFQISFCPNISIICSSWHFTLEYFVSHKSHQLTIEIDILLILDINDQICFKFVHS